jgi:signal transduction histidine kinase/CheY-like chemotaxis protein
MAGTLARLRDDSELNQCAVRVVLAGTPAVVVLRLASDMPLGSGAWLYWTASAYILVNIVLTLMVLRFPGEYRWRRLLAMALDFVAVGICFSTPGFVMLPVFAVLLTTMIGYGLRYGRGYQLIAMAEGLAVVAFTWATNPLWQANFSLSLTLFLSAIVAPLYCYFLLIRMSAQRDLALTTSRRKSQHLAQVSHDLRQPLHAVGLLATRLRGSNLSDEQRWAVEHIEQSIDTASALFQSLLDMSMLEAGAVAYHPQPLALDAALAGLNDQFSGPLAAAGGRLRIVPSATCVYADPILIKRMLHNLVSNAVNYGQGSDIVVGCRRSGQRIALWVADAGPGIAADMLPLLTQEYFRSTGAAALSADGGATGAGLGLAIVTRLAALGGLTFEMRSIAGHGTLAIISGFDPCAANRVVPAIVPAVPQTPLTGLRILLIEDDVAILQETARLLGQWGCIVVARAGLPAQLPDCDVIVSDFDLGGGSTLGASNRAARAIRLSGKPLVVISGMPLDHVRKAIKLPAALLLAKPVRPAELRSVLMSQKLALAS